MFFFLVRNSITEKHSSVHLIMNHTDLPVSFLSYSGLMSRVTAIRGTEIIDQIVSAATNQPAPETTTLSIIHMPDNKKLTLEHCKDLYYEHAAKYNNSVVEYLMVHGPYHSFEYRMKLASELGMVNYDGSQTNNWTLLKKLFIENKEFPEGVCEF